MNQPKILSNQLDQAPKTGKQYQERLEDPNLKDEIRIVMEGDKKGLKKRFQKSKYRRGLMDTLKPENKESKEMTLDDFLRLSQVQKRTKEDYVDRIQKYYIDRTQYDYTEGGRKQKHPKNNSKYITLEKLPGLLNIINNVLKNQGYIITSYGNKVSIYDFVIGKILLSINDFQNKNPQYEISQKSIQELKSIILGGTINNNIIQRQMMVIFLRCIAYIKDPNIRKEILSGMDAVINSFLQENHTIIQNHIESDINIEGKKYFYIIGIGYINITTGEILKVKNTEGNTIEEIYKTRTNIGSKNIANINTDKGGMIIDINTLEPFTDIKVNGAIPYHMHEYELGNRKVFELCCQKGSFTIDAKTLEPLKIAGTDIIIKKIGSKYTLGDKDVYAVNAGKKRMIIDAKTLEPLKIAGTDIMINADYIITQYTLGDKDVYAVNAGKKRMIIDAKTLEPLKIAGTDNIIERIGNKYTLGDKDVYEVSDGKKYLIIDAKTLEPIKIAGTDNIIERINQQQKIGEKKITFISNHNLNEPKIIDSDNLKEMNIKITGTDEKIVHIRGGDTKKIGGKEYYSGSTDKKRSILIDKDAIIDNNSIQEAIINVAGTHDVISSIGKNISIAGKQITSVRIKNNKRIFIDTNTLEKVILRTKTGEKIEDIIKTYKLRRQPLADVVIKKGFTTKNCTVNADTLEILEPWVIYDLEKYA